MSQQAAVPAVAPAKKRPIVLVSSLILAVGVGVGVFFGLQALGGSTLLDAEAGQCVSGLPKKSGTTGGKIVDCTDPSAELRIIYVFHDKGIEDEKVNACGNLVTGATASFVPDLSKPTLLCLGAV